MSFPPRNPPPDDPARLVGTWIQAAGARVDRRLAAGLALGACLAVAVGARANTQATSGGPPDVRGWQNTRWGMTEPEVRAALGARPAPVREEYADGASPLRVPVRLGPFTLQAHPVFSHRTGRLVRVQLRPQAMAAGLWEGLYEWLSTRYGTPEHRDPENEHVREYTWRFPSTIVTLVHTNLLVGRLRGVVLVYRSADYRAR